jgi:type IV secretion system protein VirD4
MPQGNSFTPSPLYFGFHFDSETETVSKTELPYIDETNLLLFGRNGAGKSTRIIVPNLVRARNRSLVVIDPKGELAAMTARARSQCGEVKILNPFHVLGLPSDGFNPLLRLNPAAPSFYDEAAALSQAMIDAGTQEASHWDESARGLLLGLTMWEVMKAQQERRPPSLYHVRLMLTEPDQYETYTDPNGKPRQRLIKGFSYTVAQMVKHGGDKIVSLVGRFARDDGGDELAGIQSTAITQTEYLLSDAMKHDLEAPNGVDFSQLGQRPTTVYIILPPDEIERMRRWTRMVITSALRELLHPSPVKTLFVLDEYYAALGHLKIVQTVWSLTRQYGIQLWPFLQSATQLEQLYGKTWENFAAQAGAVVTLGPAGDFLTAEWMSKRSGTTTEWQETFNAGASNNIQGGGKNRGRAAQPVNTPFLLPQDFFDMKPGTGRMWLPGEGTRSAPFFAPHYFRRSDLRDLVDANPYHPGSAAGSGTASAAKNSKVPFDLADWVSFLGSAVLAAIVLYFVCGIAINILLSPSSPHAAPVGQATPHETSHARRGPSTH